MRKASSSNAPSATSLENYRIGIQEWIETNISPNESATEVGAAFCHWCLERIFDLSNDDAIDAQSCSGAYDYGIDALIERRDRDDRLTLLQVIQTKYESAHEWSEITRFRFDMGEIKEGNEIDKREVNSRVQEAITQIRDAYNAGVEVKYYYITSAMFKDAEREKVQRFQSEDPSFHFYDLPQVVEVLNSKQQTIPDSIRGKDFNLYIANRDSLRVSDSTAVIAVNLSDMYEFVVAGGNDLFASNVRHYLSGTRTNKIIRSTIENEPDRFWLYNNGITVVCDDFEEMERCIRVRTPQIVNGCQTANAIRDVLSKKPDLDRKLVNGYVLVRIIRGADDEDRTNITKYTNTQNAVRGKDFFALDDFHRTLQKRFGKIHYFYEIQRGSFAGLLKSERMKYTGITELRYLVPERYDGVIPAMEATQAFAAGFKQLPAVAYRSAQELTPAGTGYEKVFDEKLEAKTVFFLYPYLIYLWAKQNGYGRGRSKDNGWQAHCLWFFIYSYFIVTLGILARVKRIDSLETSPLEIPTEFFDIIFYNEPFNLRLLSLTDEVMSRYFTDSKVEEAIGQDIRTVLVGQKSIERLKPIMLKQLDEVLKRNKILEELHIILTEHGC